MVMPIIPIPDPPPARRPIRFRLPVARSEWPAGHRIRGILSQARANREAVKILRQLRGMAGATRRDLEVVAAAIAPPEAAPEVTGGGDG